MKSHTAPRHLSQVSKTSPRRIRGQGMTEYIIVLALVALAATVAVGFFGDVVQAQFAAMGQKLSGESGTETIGLGAEAAGKAVETITTEETLGTYAQ